MECAVVVDCNFSVFEPQPNAPLRIRINNSRSIFGEIRALAEIDPLISMPSQNSWNAVTAYEREPQITGPIFGDGLYHRSIANACRRYVGEFPTNFFG